VSGIISGEGDELEDELVIDEEELDEDEDAASGVGEDDVPGATVVNDIGPDDEEFPNGANGCIDMGMGEGTGANGDGARFIAGLESGTGTLGDRSIATDCGPPVG